MRDEDRIRLKHMIDACEAAVQFVAGHRREDLDGDRILSIRVTRRFLESPGQNLLISCRSRTKA